MADRAGYVPVKRRSLQPLGARLADSRENSLQLAGPLTAEDMAVQAMDDASPTKWHLAHTTWFFETFVLVHHMRGYVPFDASFAYCFNSYYEAAGARHPRSRRGLLTRPSLQTVMAYRAHVDAALAELLSTAPPPEGPLAELITLGINHEQQHQELMLTDILALFAGNPARPAYQSSPTIREIRSEPVRWLDFPGGIVSIGHQGGGFAWDNETPRHDVLLRPYRLADRLVSNSEWQEFVTDGGYRNALLWLSDGWATVNREAWEAPLYWELRDGAWHQMTLSGLRPLAADAPVCHVSYYEADAFARWSGKRLPTEFEWEAAVASDSKTHRLRQVTSDVWQWTASAYLPYPGYRPPTGAIGEYNGKFMVNQHVLRGGSCATPRDHTRSTYRNFFYPWQRWQFCGLRLAKEIDA